MKKGIIIILIALLLIVIGFLINKFLINSPQLSDNAKAAWLEVCGDNANCKSGVEKHYLTCANSISFEKPKNKSDMAEFVSLTKMELESCFSEKIGKDFPIE